MVAVADLARLVETAAKAEPSLRPEWGIPTRPAPTRRLLGSLKATYSATGLFEERFVRIESPLNARGFVRIVALLRMRWKEIACVLGGAEGHDFYNSGEGWAIIAEKVASMRRVATLGLNPGHFFSLGFPGAGLSSNSPRPVMSFLLALPISPITSDPSPLKRTGWMPPMPPIQLLS